MPVAVLSASEGPCSSSCFECAVQSRKSFSWVFKKKAIVSLYGIFHDRCTVNLSRHVQVNIHHKIKTHDKKEFCFKQ